MPSRVLFVKMPRLGHGYLSACRKDVVKLEVESRAINMPFPRHAVQDVPGAYKRSCGPRARPPIPQSSHQSGSHLGRRHRAFFILQPIPTHAFRRELRHYCSPVASGPYFSIVPSCDRDEKPDGGGLRSKHMRLVGWEDDGGVRKVFRSSGVPGWVISRSQALAVDIVKYIVAFIQHNKPGSKWCRWKIKFETSRGENKRRRFCSLPAIPRQSYVQTIPSMEWLCIPYLPCKC
jgi:hypothetical protein